MSAAFRQQVGVWRVACAGPGDLSGVRSLVDSGQLLPSEIVAVMGKTEGNGCVNDHTREFATLAWSHFLAGHLGCKPEQVGDRVALVMSGGTEGVLSPHFTVFTRRQLPDHGRAGDKRLVLGIAHTADFAPEQIGCLAQVDATAAAVQAAMLDAGIRHAADVHFVQIKCPLLTAAKVSEALARGQSTVTRDSYESMGWSRGASALGVAVALGEVTREAVAKANVLGDDSLFSGRASASAGIELDNNVVIVLGEAMGSASPYRIAHAVMRDAVDAASVRRLLRNAFGLDPDEDPDAVARRLVNLFAKAEAAPDGAVRGERHTMLDDSDINSTRHARAAVGAVLASVAGHTALYVSGGAEAGGHTFVAETNPDAPLTVAAFMKLLPYRQRLIHVRWSGEACWVPLGEFKLGVGFENHTSHPSVGDVLFYPGGYSETELLIAYGACSFASKMGPLAGNHFLTVVEGRENLRALGTRVLWHGAQDVLFEAI